MNPNHPPTSSHGWNAGESVQNAAMLVWDTGSLSWVKATGSSGVGSNVTVTNFPSAFGATQSGTWNITNVSGTLSLPTGASTAARQDTGNTSLSSIDGKITAVNTGAVVISSGSLTANAGTNLNTSLLALESGGNLATIAAKDFATQTTLAALNAKVTAVNTGAVVVASGSVTANAGTNLNTSLLALEAGGNLATIAGKDFSTSAKQDTANTSLASIDGKLTSGVVVTLASTTITGTVTTSGVVTAVTPGTSATSLGKAEDTLASDGDTGVAMLAVRQDAPTTDVGVSGDYSFVKTDAQGRVWVNSDVLGDLLKDQASAFRSLLRAQNAMRSEMMVQTNGFIPIQETIPC